MVSPFRKEWKKLRKKSDMPDSWFRQGYGGSLDTMDELYHKIGHGMRQWDLTKDPKTKDRLRKKVKEIFPRYVKIFGEVGRCSWVYRDIIEEKGAKLNRKRGTRVDYTATPIYEFLDRVYKELRKPYGVQVNKWWKDLHPWLTIADRSEYPFPLLPKPK